MLLHHCICISCFTLHNQINYITFHVSFGNYLKKEKSSLCYLNFHFITLLIYYGIILTHQGNITKYLKVTQAQYSRYEMGINTIPIKKLASLAKFYDTSIDYLVGLTDERKPYPKIK